MCVASCWARPSCRLGYERRMESQAVIQPTMVNAHYAADMYTDVCRPLRPPAKCAACCVFWRMLGIYQHGKLAPEIYPFRGGAESGIRTHGPLRSHQFSKLALLTTQTSLHIELYEDSNLTVATRTRQKASSHIQLGSYSYGGNDGIRTHDLLLAGQALSQLSYIPMCGAGNRNLPHQDEWSRDSIPEAPR